MSRLSISSLDAREILDSRGRPTVEVSVTLEGGVTAIASVPSGASTGEKEAVELRDHDSARYGGNGVLDAVGNVRGEIAMVLLGHNAGDQEAIDRTLVEQDGTPNKSRLGANAILGASMAVARAAAVSDGRQLYERLGNGTLLPMPCFNVLNGGKHADSSLDFQEFMIVPVGAPNFAEAVRYGAETYAALKELLAARGCRTSVGDEGGFAPELNGHEDACSLLVQAFEKAGLRPAIDMAMALDPAASSFGSVDRYDLQRSGGGVVDRAELLRIYKALVDRWPIVSVEDGFAEEDWQGFIDMTATERDRIQIVGDDLLVTNPALIREGVERGACTAALIKPNQIGTVSETIEAVRICQKAGWGTMVSHRSGETVDDFIADFAVAMSAGQIKSGAPCRGERLAKYNRLMTIEHELGARADFSNPFAGRIRQ
jgi:enolase